MNHLREVLESIEQEKMLVPKHFTNVDAHRFLLLFSRAAEEAMCFEIGDIDHLCGVKCIPKLSKLPLKSCWFEFNVDRDIYGVLLKDTDHPKTRQAGFLFFRHHRQWMLHDTWSGASLDSEKENGDDVTVGMFGRSILIEADTAIVCRQVISAFLSALHCNNVHRKLNVPSTKLQVARHSRGKKPLFSYWTLNLDIHGTNNGCAETAVNGNGTKKRLHIRRGHPREYAPGKWTWVREHLAGNKSLGMIHKDYKAIYREQPQSAQRRDGLQ